MKNYIDGIGISVYRSFGNEHQEIGAFTKINLFVGQNNSGKSNILLFLKDQYSRTIGSIRKSQPLTFSGLDNHIGGNEENKRISICLPIKGERYNALLALNSDNSRYQRAIRVLLESDILPHDGKAFWFQFSKERSGKWILDSNLIKKLSDIRTIEKNDWIVLWQLLTTQQGGSLIEHWIPDTLQRIALYQIQEPKVDIIPAIRRIGEKGSQVEDFSGSGIIDRLVELQHPSFNEQHKKEYFRDINQFLKKVTGILTAEIEIPHDREMIMVHMDKKTLPLGALGTGIHEVIILAAAATVLRNQVLCIEEPELHLHPLLQKKLLRYLQEKTDNQYFFTTHSAHLLDTPGASIFHIRNQDGVSTVDSVYTSVSKSLVCVDLGYRASDILQANCVIWVEGPSDRIYLNHWIQSFNNKLVEGIHYSIMFYGGRLLSHLTANDPEVTEFISLRRLNRYISIVIDSDKDKLRGRINDTKRRIRDEFDAGEGFAWITKGREIENYIESGLIEDAVKKVHPQAVKLPKKGQFENSLHYKTSTGKLIKKADKVKIAHEIVKSPVDLSILDLKQMVEKLVKFITDSNDLE